MIQQQIRDNLTQSLRDKDKLKTTVLRSLITAFTNELVATKRKPDGQLSDDEALTVILRASKQRKDAADQFKQGNREDLAEREEQEFTIIQEYLPEMMTRSEIERVSCAKKEELGIVDQSEMGKLMGAVMKEVKGKADGNDVRAVVQSLF